VACTRENLNPQIFVAWQNISRLSFLRLRASDFPLPSVGFGSVSIGAFPVPVPETPLRFRGAAGRGANHAFVIQTTRRRQSNRIHGKAAHVQWYWAFTPGEIVSRSPLIKETDQ